MKIHLTKPATDDLEEIEHYLRQDNASAAVGTVLRVLDAIDYLATYPTMGRAGRVPKTRELIVSSTPFIVMYQMREKIIMVLRILHAAMKWPV